MTQRGQAMSGAAYFRAQAHNNAVANHRLLSACRTLEDAELSAPRTSFFPSIIHTLNHILTVDWFYVSALEGACVGYAAFDPEIPCPDIGALDAEQRQVDRRLIEVCDDLDVDSLAGEVRLLRPDGTQRERTDRTLLHLFQHQIHHRGQVHSMLSGTPARPPQLDEFFLDSPEERTLRFAEFEALGFDEDRIWR